MQVPLEVYCPDVANPEALHLHVTEQVEGLARHYPGALHHCRVAVERPHRHTHTAGWTVKVEAMVPSYGQLCASHDGGSHKHSDDLYGTTEEAFLRLRRQLDKLWHGRRDARRQPHD